MPEECCGLAARRRDDAAKEMNRTLCTAMMAGRRNTGAAMLPFTSRFQVSRIKLYPTKTP